jgi:hypothetical protein
LTIIIELKPTGKKKEEEACGSLTAILISIGH